MTNDSTKNVFSSMLTAIITKTSTAPLSRIKILQQIQGYHNEQHYTKFYNSFIKIYKAEGIKGFYKGNSANVIKAIPTYAIKLPLNDFYIKHIYKKKKEKMKFRNLFEAGIFSGLVQTSITYPLDLLRTVATQDQKMEKNSTMGNAIRDIFKKKGIKGFYSGYNASILTSPIYVGLQLSLYQQMKNQNQDKLNPVINSFISGSFAGVSSQFIMYPSDTIKKHLQINNSKNKYKGLVDCISQLYKKGGVSIFYKGLRLNMIKAMPEIAIKFTAYDQINQIL